MENWSGCMATRLKELREERGLSHVALSKKLNAKYGIEISRDSLMNYEVSDPQHAKVYKNEGMRIKYLRCLSDFYGVSTDYLLGLTDTKSLDADIASAVRITGLNEQAVLRLSETKHLPINSDAHWLKLWSNLITSAFSTLTLAEVKNCGNARIAGLVYDFYWDKWHGDEQSSEEGKTAGIKREQELNEFISNNKVSHGLTEQLKFISSYWSNIDNPVVGALYEADSTLIDVYQYKASQLFECLVDELTQRMIDEFVAQYPQFKKDGDTDA